ANVFANRIRIGKEAVSKGFVHHRRTKTCGSVLCADFAAEENGNAHRREIARADVIDPRIHLFAGFGGVALDGNGIRGFVMAEQAVMRDGHAAQTRNGGEDRKSTRLNSSHDQISYAVFCLKKKKRK